MSQKNQIKGDHFRFTVLTNKMIRMEYQPEGKFEDATTQTVTNRDLGQPEFRVEHNKDGFVVQIETDSFHLYYRGGEFSGENLFIDTKYNYQTHYPRWHYGDDDPKNLLGTARTLDGADGAIPLKPGIMSRSGFAILDDFQSMLQSGDTVSQRSVSEIDLYGFAYGHDYRAALRDYYRLTGFPPLVPRFALGNWWSRFYPYTQKSYLDLMAHFKKAGVPISVAVLDMNWHVTDIPAQYGSGWTGYTWNKKLFPEPAKFLQTLHEQGKHVTLNVHPAAGIRPSEAKYEQVAKAVGIDPASKQPVLFDLNNRNFVRAYFDLVHHPLEREGVDFWWLDWQQGAARSQKQIDPLWALNVLHFEDQQREKGNQALILSRYADPGSHRYPIGFSGDTVASWQSLKFQPYFTATATNIGYTWWSHDIGGHMHGHYDPELSLRWLQFGVFSPIMRLHSSDNPFMGKEPWNYDEVTAEIMTQFMRLRAQLVPYLFTADILTHQQGQALIEPIYYRDSEVKEAYQFKNEYFFGSEMLVVPITSPSDQETGLASATGYVPAGDWTDFFTHQMYHGPAIVKFHREASHYPVLVRSGGIIPLALDPMASTDTLPNAMTIKLFPGERHAYVLREQTSSGEAQTKFTWDPQAKIFAIKVSDPNGVIPANRTYQLDIVGSAEKIKPVNGHHNQEMSLAMKSQNHETEKMAQIFTVLQQAKVDFDLKKQLWQSIQNMPTIKTALTVTSLAPKNLSDALLEILLNDHA
ncbi:alpha-xylosidase [Lacticaseibacillus casei]|uniref:glycoside hydrolase family 31 protein n=1 Tax=Lacticaseibacillus casei TaxID=1582 RepID=UPI001109569A|nr:glycoside hydrolase family 31 protein [Lacticaseibacillus casei]TLQ49228.1 alpha-xylosidase [Lacticaseibacillus casei]